VQAADLVLGAGGFGLVVLDLGEDAGARIADAAWLRLARGAEHAGAALLVVAPEPSSPRRSPSPSIDRMRGRASPGGTFAALALSTGPGAPRFVDGGAGARRVLVGIAGAVEVARSKHLAPGGRADLTLRLR